MKRIGFWIFVVVLACVSKQTLAADYTCDTSDPRCLFFRYMVNRVDDIACMQYVEKDLDDGLCTGSQNETTEFWKIGKFKNHENQRNQEAVYTLAFVYQQCDEQTSDHPALTSEYCHDSRILNRILWGLDHLRRAQGPNGEISECHWMGINYNNVYSDDGTLKNRGATTSTCPTGNGTPVSGFTYYGAAQAINLLVKDYENNPTTSPFHNKLNKYIAAGRDGVENDQRKKAYSYLITRAAEFLTTTGRGTAPNQDVWNLLALFGLGEAYDNLGYTVPNSELDNLMTSLSSGGKADIREQVFSSTPSPDFADMLTKILSPPQSSGTML